MNTDTLQEMKAEWSEEFKDKIGAAIDDFFREADNGDGTLAFDWYSSYDIDALTEKVLAVLDGIPVYAFFEEDNGILATEKHHVGTVPALLVRPGGE